MLHLESFIDQVSSAVNVAARRASIEQALLADARGPLATVRIGDANLEIPWEALQPPTRLDIAKFKMTCECRLVDDDGKPMIKLVPSRGRDDDEDGAAVQVSISMRAGEPFESLMQVRDSANLDIRTGISRIRDERVTGGSDAG